MVIIFFFIFALLAVVSALGVVACKNPVHSALCMLGTMVSVAVIYLLHRAEFIFAIQMMVYAGGVMMLIVFVIFLLDLKKEESLVTRVGPAKIVSLGMGGLIFLALLIPTSKGRMVELLTGAKGSMSDDVLEKVGSVQFIADELFGKYLLPFELASVLLLVGLVGAMALAKKKL